MKKIWLVVVGAVLTLATLAGILFGVKACNAKKNTKNGKGANCIDTGAEVIDISKLTGDTHLMTIYIYEGENRTSLGTYTFKIVS